MAFTDPTTVHVPATGQTAPATWGTTVNTDLNWLHDVPACSIGQSGAQSIPDSTDTAITWSSGGYDPDSLFVSSDSATEVTVPVTGLYLVSLMVEFSGNATGTRILRIYKGAILRGQTYEQGDADGNHINLTIQTPASAGDKFSAHAEQNSGGPLDIGGAFAYQSQFMVSLIRET